MGPPDEWERWNKGRNDRIYASGGKSSRYLPAELRPYSYDFDNSGRWVQVPQYGYVWTPTVVIGASWSPYRHGRWIWRGGDYIWVGYEPWGWAPCKEKPERKQAQPEKKGKTAKPACGPGQKDENDPDKCPQSD